MKRRNFLISAILLPFVGRIEPELPERNWCGMVEVDGDIFVSVDRDKIFKSENGLAGPWKELVDEEQPVEKSGGWIK